MTSTGAGSTRDEGNDMVRSSATTPFGEVSYLEAGEGPAALFVHGVLLNVWLWEGTIAELTSERRCIAVDLMGHGETQVATDQDLSFAAQADMLAAFVDALGLDEVDLVANDSGGAIAQIFAARHPERVRTMTLTNCDTHDNVFPPAVVPLVEILRAGKAMKLFEPMERDIDRTRKFLSTTLEDADAIPELTLRRFVDPLVRNERSGRYMQRWMDVLGGRSAGSRAWPGPTDGTDAGGVGHRRRVLRRRLGPLAGGPDTGHRRSGRGARCPPVLPLGAARPARRAHRQAVAGVAPQLAQSAAQSPHVTDVVGDVVECVADNPSHVEAFATDEDR